MTYSVCNGNIKVVSSHYYIFNMPVYFVYKQQQKKVFKINV